MSTYIGKIVPNDKAQSQVQLIENHCYIWNNSYTLLQYPMDYDMFCHLAKNNCLNEKKNYI